MRAPLPRCSVSTTASWSDWPCSWSETCRPPKTSCSQIAARDTVLPYVRAAVLNGVVLVISLVIAVTRHATESLPPANLQATPSYFVRIAGVGPSNR